MGTPVKISTTPWHTRSSSVFERLRKSRLESWAVTCLTLLEHLSGLEEVIADPAHRPIEVIRKAVETALARKDGSEGDRLLDELSVLPVFLHCAGATTERGQSARWNPLTEPLGHFQHRHGDRVTFWEDWTQYPSPAEVRAWLRAKNGSG